MKFKKMHLIEACSSKAENDFWFLQILWFFLLNFSINKNCFFGFECRFFNLGLPTNKLDIVFTRVYLDWKKDLDDISIQIVYLSILFNILARIFSEYLSSKGRIMFAYFMFLAYKSTCPTYQLFFAICRG